jgi:hypothetical protein
MSKTVTISDNLATLVEARRRAAGFATIDAAAQDLITHGLIAAAARRSDEELRALIDEADASGPAGPWDAAAVKAEVLRRYAYSTTLRPYRICSGPFPGSVALETSSALACALPALADLEHILDYIPGRSPQGAVHVQVGIKAIVRPLAPPVLS